MKKILGLDIGTNSIGWALITEPEHGETGEPEILRCGVKVIAMDQKQIKAFQGGQALTANQERRLKRQMRRNNWRYKLRREALVARLVDLGWFPPEWKDDLQARHEALKLHNAPYIYGLRDKAARGEKVSLRELGLIWYHLNQKRGYKSNRKAQDEEETNDSVLLSQISANDQILRESGLTVGQYLYQQYQANPRQRLKGKVFSRNAYLEEFDRIWEAQTTHYPDILTPELREEIRDRIIYYQRPLKSQKHLIAECPFEKRYYKDAEGQLQVKGIKVAPRSSPVFQEYKIWQTLANIRITNLALAGQMGFDARGERPLTQQEREQAYQFLLKRKKVKSDTLLRSALKLDPRAGGYSIANYEEIEGDVTRAAILGAFKKVNQRPPQWLFRFDPTDELESQPLFQLWHMLYSIEDPGVLQRKLREKFGFEEELPAALTSVNFKEDYGSLSTRAMQQLIPHLKNGFTYDKARMKVFEETGNETYRSQPIPKNEQNARTLAPAIEQIKVNSLRNPVVERIVQHVINLVNAIIADKSLVSDEERQSGKFEIRMEMARELKQTAKQRQKTSKQIKAREQQREEARKRLIEEKILSRPSRADIDRYLIWLEGNQMCPYTFKPIPLADLFNGRCEVDHIIPRSRLFDDSQLNKVVCYASANREKGNLTAYEYMVQKGELDKFRAHVLSTNYPYPKKKRLLSPEVPTDFIQRQLKETQYISRVVREKLREVSHEVRTTTGAITGFLRHEWGLSNLLHDLNFPKYEAQGLVEEWTDEETGEVTKQIKDWSKRLDHRHHALDALVVALTKPAHVHYLNNLNKQFGNIARENGWRTPLKSPVASLYEKAKAAIEPILVKHQKKSRVVTPMTHRLKVKGHFSGKTQEVLVPRGPLHKESVYGLIHHKGREEFVIRYPLDTNFKPEYVPYIVDEKVQQIVEARLRRFGNDPKKAFADLENDPLWFDEARKIPIKRVRCRTGLQAVVPIHQKADGTPVDYVQTRNNHHLAIYQRPDGSRFHRIVTFWEAVERMILEQPLYQPTIEDGQLLMTLSANDMFVFELDPDEIDFTNPANYKDISKYLYRVQKMTGDDKKLDIWFRHHLDPTTAHQLPFRRMKQFYRVTNSNRLVGTKVWLDQTGRICRVGQHLRQVD